MHFSAENVPKDWLVLSFKMGARVTLLIPGIGLHNRWPPADNATKTLFLESFGLSESSRPLCWFAVKKAPTPRCYTCEDTSDLKECTLEQCQDGEVCHFSL